MERCESLRITYFLLFWPDRHKFIKLRVSKKPHRGTVGWDSKTREGWHILERLNKWQGTMVPQGTHPVFLCLGSHPDVNLGSRKDPWDLQDKHNQGSLFSYGGVLHSPAGGGLSLFIPPLPEGHFPLSGTRLCSPNQGSPQTEAHVTFG